MSIPNLEPPNAHCDSCGDELTDAEVLNGEGDDDDATLCDPCFKAENEDPDARYGGHDNPFEDALWDANPPPPPYEHDWS